MPNPSPGRISVRTPPPIAAIASEPNLNPLDDIVGDHVDSDAFQAYVEASSIQQPPLDVVFAQEQVVELDTAMEFEPDSEANLCKVHRCTVWVSN